MPNYEANSDLRPEEFRSPVLRHSGLGITSLIIFVLACGSLTGSWLEDKANKAYLASQPGPYNLTAEAVLSLLFGCSGFLLLLIGGALGFASLFQTQRRKLFSGLGLALNSVLLFLLIVLGAWIMNKG